MMRITIGLLLLCVLCTLGAEPAPKTKVSVYYLKEQRNKFMGAKNTSIGGYEHLSVNLKLEGIKQIHSFGNLKITEAKTDTGVDLMRRPKDKGAFFGITDRPHFQTPLPYQLQQDKIDVEVVLHTAPRDAAKLSLKGSMNVLVGGESKTLEIATLPVEGNMIVNDALKESGVKISLSKEKRHKTDTQRVFDISGNESVLQKIALVDAAGTALKATGSFYAGRQEGLTYWVNAAQKIPKDAKLQITFIKGGKIITLPIVFDALELP